MSTSSPRLGRGLNALLGEKVSEKKADDIYQELPLLSITPCASQPRKYFNDEQLKELASSIQEKGIIQPLVVRPIGGSDSGKYEIVAGERRWRAAKMLGLENVPAVVRAYSDSDAMTIALIENIQRENLNPIEEAEAFALLKEQYSLSQEELARNLGKSRSALANALRLLNLPKEMRELIFEGKISAAHGRTLLALHDEALQNELANRIINYNLSVRDVENIVEYANAYHQLPPVKVALSQNSAIEQVIDGQTGEVKQEEALVEEQKEKPARRLAQKPQFFKDLQKELRLVHRGTSLSGNLESGKITLPFAGQEELDRILALFSLTPLTPLELDTLEAEAEESKLIEPIEIGVENLSSENIESLDLEVAINIDEFEAMLEAPLEKEKKEDKEIDELAEILDDVLESELSAELNEITSENSSNVDNLDPALDKILNEL